MNMIVRIRRLGSSAEECRQGTATIDGKRIHFDSLGVLQRSTLGSVSRWSHSILKVSTCCRDRGTIWTGKDLTTRLV